MSQILYNGSAVYLPIAVGHSLLVDPFTGTYSVRIVSGIANAPVVLASNSPTRAKYGPFGAQHVIELSTSATAAVDFDVGVSPATDQRMPVYAYADDTLVVGGQRGPVGIVRQEARSGDYELAAADANTILPSSGAGTTTLNNGVFGPSFVGLEIPIYTAGARVLAAGPGITLAVIGGGAASVSTKNSALFLTRGATATEFIVQKLVA